MPNLPEPVQFTKSKKFLAGGSSATVEFTAVKDPATLDALLQNEPFPKEVTLSSINLQGEAGTKEILFAGGSGNVTFKANGGFFSGLGVYMNPTSLLKDLQLDDDISEGFDVGSSPNDIFVALRWGYDVKASAQGSVALGAGGSVTFSGDAGRDAAYAVVRLFNKDARSRDSVEATVNSWVLPKQISSADDIEPGTWIIASVDGSFAAKVGITYGLDYSWVRKLDAGGLSGDIGLKLHLGVSAALGFSASGKYAVVVSRQPAKDDEDQSKLVRLRLFKQKQNGWDINLDAGADVQMNPSDAIPANLDDFIKAVFGIHGAQILKELDKWTGSPDTLPATLAGDVEGYAEKFLGAVTGINLDTALPELQSRIDEARAKFTGFITQWNALPQRVSALLQKVVSGAGGGDVESALQEIGNLSQQIASGDPGGIRQLLQNALADVEFSRTTAGQWLETAAAKGILNVLSDEAPEIAKLKDIATKSNNVLDGKDVEDVLKKFQQYVDDKLNLDKIVEIANSNNLDLMKDYELLKARLEAFLERELDLDALKKIAAAVKNFRDKSADYYEAARGALTKKYSFTASATYQSSSTSAALLDVTFDFGDPSTLPFYSDAVDGKFNDLFLRQQDGVTIKEARLSHAISKQTHVEIHLPLYDRVTDHINNSFADVSPKDDKEGRVLVYELNAEDTFTVKARLNSTLAVGGFWNVGANGVRVHTDPDDAEESLNYNYSLRMFKPDAGLADLTYLLKPYAERYFFSVFGGDGLFESWINALDNAAGGKFGKTLISLQLSLPTKVTAGWLKAPQDKKSPVYVNMSKAMQERLKELTPYGYFQDPNHYKNNNINARCILAYAAMPPTANLVGDPPDIKESNSNIYWDYLGRPEYVRFMLERQETTQRLAGLLTQVIKRLNNTPGFASVAGDYNNTDKVLSNAKTSDGLRVVNYFLRFESKFVDAVQNAAVTLAKFQVQAPNNPDQARVTLSKFGSDITDIFNDGIGGVYGGDKSRPLSTLLFVEAARELDPTLADVTPNAMLEIIVLKDTSTFDPDKYLNPDKYPDGGLPPKDDVVLQTRVVSPA